MLNSKRFTVFLMLAGLLLSAAVFAGEKIESGPARITLEQARKIALKRIEGTVEDEFSIEDDEGNATDYIFYIKDKKGKTWEVQIGAEKGDVVSAEMQPDEDEDDPPADEEPPAQI